MHIKVPYSSKENIAELLKKKKYISEANYFSQRYVSGRQDSVIIEVKCKITSEFITTLQEIGRKLDLKGVISQCTQILNMLENSGEQKVVSMRALELGLIEYIKNNAIDGWIYKQNRDDSMTPYLVDSIKYNPPVPDRNKLETISINLIANSPHKDNTKQKKLLSFQMINVNKKNIAQILASKGFYKESAEMKSDYDKSIVAYQKIQSRFGEQFQSDGKAIVYSEDNKLTEVTLLGSKGKLRKLVNDEEILNREFNMYSDADFWQEHSIKKGQFEEIPFQPYLFMFDLEEHHNIWINAIQVQEYKYDKTLKHKLVLPKEHIDLLDILIHDIDTIKEDMISGKSGGSIILCMGPSGLGKTLTAEIYAELIGRPLYNVHSGQLGTDPEQVEDRLNIILRRAERWGAVSLLDEADVYIRKRDNSIHHNAIVAAFLRKLEYFSGFLFMTTNRTNDVDEAIISRSSAILRYETPTPKNAALIWNVLAKQFKIRMTKTLIEKLVRTYPSAAGRDIKKLLIIADKYNRIKGRSVNAELFRQCAMVRGIKTNNIKDIIHD
jgi:ribosomal protein S8